jgi:hypothetical protein
MSGTSYTSGVNLNLAQLPDNISDPIVYKALADVYTALEVLAQATSSSDTPVNAAEYIKYHTSVKLITNSYTVKTTDAATLLASTTGGDITITLPPVLGFSYHIKHVAGLGKVTVQGQSGSLIDGSNYILDVHDAISVVSDGTSWYVY